MSVLPSSLEFRTSGPAASVGAWPVVLGTALAYALAGIAALLLAEEPGAAPPLYPPAGIALAAALVYGRSALPGVALGALATSAAVHALRGQPAPMASTGPLLPLAVALGAVVQAWLGAALVRRKVSQPMVLSAPRDVLRFALLGGALACAAAAAAVAAVLAATRPMAAEAALAQGLAWWLGNTAGVLIAAPLALTIIGRPRADWRPRRRTLGVPLLIALLLMVGGMLELGRLDRQRKQATFERDADRLASAAEVRLAAPLHALQALHGAAGARTALDRETLARASRWWLAQPFHLQAMGSSEWLPLDAIAPFEEAARVQGLPAYRVFDRDGGAARAADRGVVALRQIEPAAGNAAALGVNGLSIPAARAAILAARNSGEPAATAGFHLTQSGGDETGVVLYRALYRQSGTGEPAGETSRVARFAGVVFVAVDLERALSTLAQPGQPGQHYLRWCLLDTDPAAARARLAGPVGCETQMPGSAPTSAGSAHGFEAVRPLKLASRTLALRIAAPDGVPAGPQEMSWLLSAAGLAASALLGALLLTVTGHSRRTELAVKAGTADLRREIAERTQAERALRESEARLRSIVDHVPLGVMFLDPQGKVIDCNPRLCEMLGSSVERLRSALVASLVHADEVERIRALRRELLAGALHPALECVRVRSPGGRELLARLSVSALRDSHGRVVRMVGVMEDITEHLRLQASERALHRAEEANRAKSEFVSRMSHELRTPLNAMIGFSQLLGLDREPGLAPHQKEWTQQIQRAGWHLLEMINETLDLARIESGAVQLSMAPVALAPLVAACSAMVAAPAGQRGICVDHHLEPDATAAVGDATRIKQVLTNLLSNAVKYNRSGGAVNLSSRRVAAGAGDAGDWVEIAVADTGMGMTAEQQALLFQPYNRLGREGSGIEGTGIGLVISRRLAELMGGTLTASSAAGQGSIFTLRLPAAAAADSPVLVVTDTSPAPYQQRLVHYVEDNETNIEVMRGIFVQRPQIRLETSMLGLDGLAAIRATQPDLVLLDMQLPDISGLELLRHLKQDDALADIPVVVVSADATALHMQKGLTLGARHYVTKPLEVARFLALVDEILLDAETRWG